MTDTLSAPLLSTFSNAHGTPLEDEDYDSTCPICMDYFTEPVKTGCGHSFCKKCLGHWLNSKPVACCPVCVAPLPRTVSKAQICVPPSSFVQSKFDATVQGQVERLRGSVLGEVRAITYTLKDHKKPVLYALPEKGGWGIYAVDEVERAALHPTPGSQPLASVRGNLMGTVWQVNETDGWRARTEEESSLVRVVYESNIFKHGPRKLKLELPGGLKLKNKKPTWDDKLSSWTMNFHGRVTESSNKNFIVEHDGPRTNWSSVTDHSVIATSVAMKLPPSNEALLFGRTDDDLFSLDYKQPFNAVQAFGVALSAIQFKACVE